MNLSLQPQEQFSTIAREAKLIKRTIRVTETLKEKSGEKERQSVRVSDIINHDATALTSSTRKIIIDRLQFIRSLIHNPQSRGFDVVASHRKSTEGK